MLNTAGDIITEFLNRNSRTTTDGFITDAITRSWLQNSSLRAAAAYKWPFTEGKASTTYASTITDENGNTIINYPEGWKADSIRYLTIGGKRMKKLDYTSFLRFLENNTTSGTQNSNYRIYTDFARQLYVNTGADVSGTLTCYGQYTPSIDPTDLNATTVFSGYDEEGNEAIVLMMTAYLKRKEHLNSEAEEYDKNAKDILAEVYKRVGDEQYGYQTQDQPMFERIDVVRGRGQDGANSIPYRENQF